MSDPNKYRPVAYRYVNGVVAEMEMHGDGEYVLASDYDALYSLAKEMNETLSETYDIMSDCYKTLDKWKGFQ